MPLLRVDCLSDLFQTAAHTTVLGAQTYQIVMSSIDANWLIPLLWLLAKDQCLVHRTFTWSYFIWRTLVWPCCYLGSNTELHHSIMDWSQTKGWTLLTHLEGDKLMISSDHFLVPYCLTSLHLSSSPHRLLSLSIFTPALSCFPFLPVPPFRPFLWKPLCISDQLTMEPSVILSNMNTPLGTACLSPACRLYI